jgi:hypothetical protein
MLFKMALPSTTNFKCKAITRTRIKHNNLRMTRMVRTGQDLDTEDGAIADGEIITIIRH